MHDYLYTVTAETTKCTHSANYVIGKVWLTPESDVCRRQILTTKVDLRTVKVQIFLMVVEP